MLNITGHSQKRRKRPDNSHFTGLGGKRGRIGKGRIRVCSCVRGNLEALQIELKRHFQVNACVSKEQVNSRGDSYFELSINRRADVEKIKHLAKR